MSKATSETDANGCLVIETLGAAVHTLVFDTDRAKAFASLSRRRLHRGDRVSSAITQIVSAVTTSGRVARRRVVLRDGSTVHLDGAPVLGPGGQIFAVEIVTSTHDPMSAPAVTARTIGGFEWDPEQHTSSHSTTLETAIFGVTTQPRDRRSSAEIFRHIDEFARMPAIGDFVADLRSGGPRDSDTFDSDLLMTGVDGRRRRVNISCRAVQRPDGSWTMRGLVHDISDISPPAPASGYGAGAVRSVLRMVAAGECSGIGHINFPTVVVTEWFTAPPAPLHRWTTQNAEIHPDDRAQLVGELGSLSTGDVDRVLRVCRVRFIETDWLPAEFEIRPMSRVCTGQGLIKVTPLPAQPEDPAPDTMASIDQRSGPLAET